MAVLFAWEEKSAAERAVILLALGAMAYGLYGLLSK